MGSLVWKGLGLHGEPPSTGLIIVGTDPYLIDLTCARIAKFDYRKVKNIKSG